ncbi:MAG: hypothetical protein ACE5HI_20220 [bacterium]
MNNLEAKPNNGEPKYSFYLSELPELKHPEWPPPPMMLANFPEFQTEIDKALDQTERFKDKVFSIKIWSPYPIRSYSLRGAEVKGEILLLRYHLFPTTSPVDYGHEVVAQVVCEIHLEDGSIESGRCWVDDLREDELSEINRRQIRLAESQN